MEAMRRVNPRLQLLLALALCLRALVPDGFMPGNGSLLELCTPEGMRTVLVDSQTGELLDADPDHDGPACPWTAVFASAVLSEWTHVVGALPDAAPAHLARRSTRPSLTRTLPPARAPPVSSFVQSA